MRGHRILPLFLGLLLACEVLATGPAVPRYKRLFRTWKDNPHASHAFFTPSAIALPHGNGYYENSYVLMHSAWYAPLDGLRIGGGFQMMTLLASFRKYRDKLDCSFLAF